MKAKDYNKDWSIYFRLNPESKSGISWNVPRYFNGSPNFDRVGSDVGSISKGKNNSYWTVGLGGEGSYLIHRIIWVMINGSVSDCNDIDHEDGDGLNNSLSNLREVAKTINSRNKRKRSDNKTGKTGITYIKTRTGSGHQANFYDIKRKRHSRFFSELKYGLDNSLKLATDWYNLKKEEMINAGYTSRHGH